MVVESLTINCGRRELPPFAVESLATNPSSLSLLSAGHVVKNARVSGRFSAMTSVPVTAAADAAPFRANSVYAPPPSGHSDEHSASLFGDAKSSPSYLREKRGAAGAGHLPSHEGGRGPFEKLQPLSSLSTTGVNATLAGGGLASLPHHQKQSSSNAPLPPCAAHTTGDDENEPPARHEPGKRALQHQQQQLALQAKLTALSAKATSLAQGAGGSAGKGGGWGAPIATGVGILSVAALLGAGAWYYGRPKLNRG